MRAHGGPDGANTCMTLVCDYGSRNRNGPVSRLALLCAQMGDVTGNALFALRCRCDTCGSLYPDLRQLRGGFSESLPSGWVKPHVKVVTE